MRTGTPVTRPSRRNQHLARLDRAIRKRGESMQLRHIVGTSPNTGTARLNLKGIVKTFGTQQIIAGIVAVNYLILISPTDLRRARWPGPRGDMNTFKPTGYTPATDNTLPMINDWIVFRGRTTIINLVNAIYDGDEVIRIELKVVG